MIRQIYIFLFLLASTDFIYIYIYIAKGNIRFLTGLHDNPFTNASAVRYASHNCAQFKNGSSGILLSTCLLNSQRPKGEILPQQLAKPFTESKAKVGQFFSLGLNANGPGLLPLSDSGVRHLVEMQNSIYGKRTVLSPCKLI